MGRYGRFTYKCCCGVTPDNCLVFTDGFGSSDGATLSTNYTEVSSTWGYSTNKLRSSPSTDAWLQVNVPTTEGPSVGASGEIKATLRFTAGVTAARFAFGEAGAVSTDQQAVIFEMGSGKIRIIERAGDATSETILRECSHTFTTGVDYEIRACWQTNTLATLYVDGIPRLAATPTVFPTNVRAFFATGASVVAPFTIDDLELRNLHTAPPGVGEASTCVGPACPWPVGRITEWPTQVQVDIGSLTTPSFVGGGCGGNACTTFNGSYVLDYTTESSTFIQPSASGGFLCARYSLGGLTLNCTAPSTAFANSTTITNLECWAFNESAVTRVQVFFAPWPGYAPAAIHEIKSTYAPCPSTASFKASTNMGFCNNAPSTWQVTPIY